MWLLFLAVFISVWTLSILDPCLRTYHIGWTQGNLGSPFSIDPQAIIHNKGIIRIASTKSLCFISTIPAHFIHSTIEVSKYYFVFISLIFIFHIILQTFKEISFSQLLPGAIHWRVINTENSIIRGSGVTLRDTNPFFGSVSTLSLPLRPEWSRISNPFVRLSPGEKKMGPQLIFFSHVFDGVFDHSWYTFQLKYWCLCFFFCKTQVQDPALWCRQYCHISRCNHWKKSSLFQFHVFPCKMVSNLLKWLKETSFYEKRKKLQRHELLHKRTVHIKKKERVYELFGLKKSWYYGFLGVKVYLF